jgi:HK97 family phage portal protein
MYGDDMREIVDHPILDLLNSANPYLNGFDLSVLRVLYGELTGNAYLHPVIDDASGVPIELWPLAPQHVEVIPDEDTFIRGYVYGVDSQRKQIFEPDEVIHFRRPNPGNLFYGMGKVEAAFGVIASNEALHQMDLSTFQNSARPDYAVVVKGTPTGDQLDRFQQQVEQRLRGTRKDGNFITVTGDVQFTPLNFPPKDIAGREEIVEEIAAVFGVPVSMLKANDPNLASATSGFAQWREGTVLPLVRMDEQELNQRLLGMFGLGEEYCLAYDNPVPSDLAFELQERQTAVAGGWRTPNEARLEEGREPVENEFADQLLVNGQPLGGAAQMGGGFLSMDEPEQEPKMEEPEMDVAFASSLIESLRSRTLSKYSVVKMLQGCGFSRAVAERMVEAEEKEIEKIHSMPGEPFRDCVERGVEVITAEGYDYDEAISMAEDQCSDKSCGCGTKTIEDIDVRWSLSPCGDDQYKCETKSSEGETEKVYEWPKSVRKYRLGIEGLPSDFARVKAEDGEPSADEDIREGEQKTPAMAIASTVSGGLAEVQKTLIAAIESGEIASIPGKASGSSRAAEIRKILKTLSGLEGKILDDLVASISKAAAGGGSAGIARVNELLSGAGSGRVGSPAVSEALAKAIQKRAGLIAKAVVQDTVKRFVGSLDLTFSIQGEVARLQSLGDLSPSRAETIARTESANAYHEGQIDAWKESGAVREKHFLKAPGACPFCVAVEKRYGERAKALPVDAPMVRGGETITANGKTLTPKFDSPGIVHPNCRCDFIPVIEGL